MSLPADKPEPDAHYWSEQMHAIAAHRDRDSFMRVYDHFAPRLLGYLMGMGVRHAQAEDLVQEALLRLWRKASMFDPARASLSTWLFRITRNLHIDSLRRDPHWLPIQDGIERLEVEHMRVEGSDAESFTDHALLATVIDSLPDLQARLLRMSYFEAKSHREIAEELDMPLGTVKSSLRRAFGKLSTRIKQRP